ncbi:MAG: hypothetical protein IPN96_18540 [Anaerolineales bacterium]|nr:hypothetical protein [Anaerolineales bacterium]
MSLQILAAFRDAFLQRTIRQNESAIRDIFLETPPEPESPGLFFNHTVHWAAVDALNNAGIPSVGRFLC